MSRAEEDENNEYTWRRSPFPNPSEPGSIHHHLEQYELSSLQCPCCHFLYDNAVSLRPCHHSFCNQCIRGNLATRNGVKVKRECPVCKCKIEMKKGNSATVKELNDEEAIIPNYGLQKAVDEYKQMRGKLYDTLVELETLKRSASLGTQESPTSAAASNDIDKKRAASSIEDAASNTETKRPRRTCAGKIPHREGEDYNNRTDEKKTNDIETNVLDLTASFHDDSALLARPMVPLSVARLKYKSFNLAGKKRKDLVAMCKSEGIDCTGSDVIMKDRIKRFADYWRSEYDREVQKSKEEVTRDFKKQEEVRAREEMSLKQSKEKKYVTKMNKSREELGSAGGNRNNKVTSGNSDFDAESNRQYHILILSICKEKGYDSFQDMVSKVCAKTERQVPQNLSKWYVDNGDDSDCELVCQSSANTSNASSPPVAVTALSESRTHAPVPTCNSSSIVNPYDKAKTSTSCHVGSTSTNQTNSSPQYSTRTVVNPYTSTPPTVSTPISSKPPTPVVTDIKPPSNSRISYSRNDNMLPMSQSSTTSYRSPQQQSFAPPKTSVETWSCQNCTFTNEIKIWSRSKRKCAMCYAFAK